MSDDHDKAKADAVQRAIADKFIAAGNAGYARFCLTCHQGFNEEDCPRCRPIPQNELDILRKWKRWVISIHPELDTQPPTNFE